MSTAIAMESTTALWPNVRQAAFIGVGAMVGAGIFALLGSAGEVAGAAVWISFLIAGAVAGLQGYSFAKFGARYPSAGGLLEYVVRGFGTARHRDHRLDVPRRQRDRDWHGRRVVRQLRQRGRGRRRRGWIKVFAAPIVLVMAALNMLGSRAVARCKRWSSSSSWAS